MTLLQKNLGNCSNDVHFQAYILEGIVRWNSQRSIAAIDSPESNIRSFDPKLRLKLKCLRSAVLDKSTDIDFHPPAAYTRELFGIEYLYSEMGSNLTLGVNIDIEIEEGLNDDDDFLTFFPEEEDCLDSELDVAVLSFMINEEDNSEEDQFLDFNSIEGWAYQYQYSMLKK